MAARQQWTRLHNRWGNLAQHDRNVGDENQQQKDEIVKAEHSHATWAAKSLEKA
jgi:hypothetical protein